VRGVRAVAVVGGAGRPASCRAAFESALALLTASRARGAQRRRQLCSSYAHVEIIAQTGINGAVRVSQAGRLGSAVGEKSTSTRSERLEGM